MNTFEILQVVLCRLFEAIRLLKTELKFKQLVIRITNQLFNYYVKKLRLSVLITIFFITCDVIYHFLLTKKIITRVKLKC